jgi:MFS family permease
MSSRADQSPTTRNFWLNVTDGALFATAMAVAPVNILLPAYVRKFTDNEYLVNLVVALFLFGVTAPQIFVARYLDSLPRKKPLMLFTGIIQRLPWLVMALAAWFIPPERATLHLIILFTMLGVFAFSCGANIPVWLILLGKLIPERQRGRLMAWRQMIAMGLAVGGAAGARYILKAWAFPHNYALLFLCFFLLTVASYIALLFIREDQDDPVHPPPGLREHLGRLFHLLREDRNYARYVVASVLLTMGGLYGGLITSYGIDRFGLANRDY